ASGLNERPFLVCGDLAPLGDCTVPQRSEVTPCLSDAPLAVRLRYACRHPTAGIKPRTPRV
ncbi:MAG: hypothetical protein ACT4QC_03925, partial [Planctomycetaceae bacterium]